LRGDIFLIALCFLCCWCCIFEHKQQIRSFPHRQTAKEISKVSIAVLICSNLPQTVTVDTGFCADDSLQTSNEKQLTYTAGIAAKNSSVSDQ